MNFDFSTEAWIVIAIVAVAAFILGRNSASGGEDKAEREMRARQDAENAWTQLSPDVQAQVEAHIQAGKTIEAIRLVREATGMGLKQAKQIVDARKAAMGMG